jgi:hypothetical protein
MASKRLGKHPFIDDEAEEDKRIERQRKKYIFKPKPAVVTDIHPNPSKI